MASCKKDMPPQPANPTSGTTTNPNSESFKAVINSGGTFPQPVNSTAVTTSLDSVINNDTLWACVTETYSVVQGLQEFPLFNPNSSVVYPGNLLQGATLLNATPDVIVVDRAGGTFSIDVLSGGNNLTETVPEVTKSNVIQALNDIIDNAPSDVPANISFLIQEVNSEKELAFALGFLSLPCPGCIPGLHCCLPFCLHVCLNVAFLFGFLLASCWLPFSIAFSIL